MERPYSFTYPSTPPSGSAITKIHHDAQDLEIVDRLIEPQTIAHFLAFATGGPLPNGKQCELERITEQEVRLLHSSPDSDNAKTIIDRVMDRIGSIADGARMCTVGKNIQSMKNRLWEGIIPLSDQRWNDKGLNKADNLDLACQHLSAVCATFEYLNQPEVAKNMRDTFNLIWEHWREFEEMANARRTNQQPLSVTRLWTAFISAHFEVMTERAHRWVTVKANALRGPLLHTIRSHRPLDPDFMDNVQWRATDGLHKLNEITAVADYGILIPMDGYRGYTAAAVPPNVPAGLRSASLTERRNAYIPRLKQVSRAAQYESLTQARRRNETHHVADPVALHYTALNQINGQHQLRREVRGDPVEPVPREPWIMRLLDGMEKSNGRIRGFGVAIYRLTYQQRESEWNAFKDKLEGHIADWGRGQTGSAAIKPYLRLHWMDGRVLGIAEGDVEEARKHFHDHGSSFDAKDHVNKRFFLVVDEPVVASYTGSTYCAATTIPNDGDFTGFVLAVDADYNPAEGIQRLDESPGYHGQMRILGNLVWGDLYAMHAAQSALLEDLWPLALDHPNTAYIGPVVPFETRSWRLQNGLRNVCLRAVADYAHERIHGTPFPVAPTRQFTVPGVQTTPNISTPANPRPGPSDDRVRTFMLRAFQRHLRRNNQHREALMVDEMLLTPEGQMPDMERMRRRVELAEMDGLPAPPTLSQEEEDELERREFERTFCQQQ